jgi:hypothetical protein
MLLASSCRAERYQNTEYGFNVNVVPGGVACRSEPPAHDHGVMMLLAGGSTECRSPELHAYISVTADYNVLDRSSPQEALDDILTGRRDEVLGTTPKDLEFPGRPSAVARSESFDGWTTIWVVSQGGTRPDTEDPTPRVNYFAVLHSRPNRLDGDLSLLREVLKGVEIFSPQ